MRRGERGLNDRVRVNVRQKLKFFYEALTVEGLFVCGGSTFLD